MNNLIRELLNKNIIKFGNFTLKSGLQSNLYFDLRTLISYPLILNQVLNEMYSKIKHSNFDLICGIAYTGIPMASKISLDYNIPMLIIRKERKNYGTKNLIEGVYQSNQKCLMLDDVITTGSSLIENINLLESENLKVEDIIVFIDRRDNRNDVSNYRVHSVFNVEDIMAVIESNISVNPVSNTMSQRLEDIIYQKRTNLVLSADLTNKDSIINLLQIASPYICMVKLHLDIIEDVDADFIYQLKKMADVHRFMIMEDRKFADIGNTVKYQLINQIVDLADFITVHSIMGQGTLDAIRQVAKSGGYDCNVFLIESVSSQNNLIDINYTLKTEELAVNNSDIVSGFITQKRLSTNTDFFYAIPGVNIGTSNDQLGQQYNTPEAAIWDNGGDMVIVGRGIYEAENIEEAVKMYHKRAWNAFEVKMDKLINN